MIVNLVYWKINRHSKNMSKFLSCKASVISSSVLGLYFILVPVTAKIVDRLFRCDTCNTLIETLRKSDVDIGGVAEFFLKSASLHWSFYVFSLVSVVGLLYFLPDDSRIQKLVLIFVFINAYLEVYFLLKIYILIYPWDALSYWIRKI